MGPYDNFRLVSGYLPEIDRPPEAALKLGLHCRVSAVLNDEDAPHTEVYWDLVEAFVETLAADSIVFEMGMTDPPLVFTSVQGMREYVNGHPEFGVPFDRATFYVMGRATTFIHLEPYAMCGGPVPYCDSWTFAIYRKADDMPRLRDGCYRVCARHGLPVLEEMCGLPAPKGPPWSKRLLRWLLK